MRAAVAGLVLLLGACVAAPRAPQCADPGLGRFLGRPLSVAMAELRLQEGDYKVDYPSPFGPTLEAFPDRLRMSVDEAGVIRSIGCG
ncbi:MAG: hypothetical protein ACK40I_11875 [Tabrizicola sp.]